MRRSTVLLGLLALSACTPEPYGPENAWYHATVKEVPDDLVGTGIEPGDTLANFTFKDQNGDDVELYQFYGQVVQLVLMAQWCPPCKEEAPEIEAASVALAESGVTIVEVMLENNQGDPAEVADTAAWATEYGATHPIVSDREGVHDPMLNGGYPTLPVLDREMKIVNPDNFPFNAELLAELAAETAEE